MSNQLPWLFLVNKMQWQKNLYDNLGYPDNYTDDSFLERLRKNVKPNNATACEALNLGASVSIRLSIVVLFNLIFIWLNNGWITPDFFFTFGTVFTIVGYFLYNVRVPNISERLSKDFRMVLLFLTFGYILSPVLRTLTETISTDTIYAMTTFMFAVHLVFNKYGCSQISLSDSLSITSPIFGSLMLASRLATPLHAFSLLTVSVQCFVLLPFLLRQLSNKIVLSNILAIYTTYTVYTVSQTLSYGFVVATIFVHYICPFWYLKCQRYKDNIYGPWDEAVISS